MVYLHCEDHGDTTAFCRYTRRGGGAATHWPVAAVAHTDPTVLALPVLWDGRQTLATATLRDFVASHNILLWAGDVREAEAVNVSERLQAMTYPFLAILDLSASQPRINVVEGATGPPPPCAHRGPRLLTRPCA